VVHPVTQPTAEGRPDRPLVHPLTQPTAEGRPARPVVHPVHQLLEHAVWDALTEVRDPEIPTVSLVDLGIVHRVEVTADRISVELLPTFTGCPALDVIRTDVEERLSRLGVAVDVTFTNAAPWTSDRITSAGRAQLQSAGFAPPDPDVLQVGGRVACPYCGSRRTMMENAFGPTLCRSIWYCTACRQPFEQFKAI